MTIPSSKIKAVLPILILSSLCMLGFKSYDTQEEDLSDCLKKVKSEWSRPCLQCTESAKSYRVYFVNDCKQTLDVKLAAQEKDRRWRTFSFRQVQAGDTLVAYACRGTGKYLYWVKHPDDLYFVFPSDEEINATYSE